MPWTRDRIVTAIVAWAEEHGRPPTYNQWRRGDPKGQRPTAATVQAALGSWSAGLEAAGLEPRAPGTQAPELCAAGLHPMTEAYVRPDGGRQCRACVNERERRQRARRAADRERKAMHARRRLERGLCVRCGKRPPAPERTCCTACLAKLRDADARRRQAKRAA
jgi:hypothetical protein